MLKDVIDPDLLRRFEEGLDPRNPHLSTISARIIGYGEMSTIFVIDHPGQAHIAYKRMPIFRTDAEMDAYERLFDAYNTGLGRIGLQVPEWASARVVPKRGNRIVYTAQARLPSASIGNALLHTLPEGSIALLLGCVLRELAKVFASHPAHPALIFGIDGQISNWALKHGRADGPVTEASELYYLDTGTPLIRRDGVEQLDPELFLRCTPSFLVWLIRLLFLEDVMTRYYDFRKVTIDLIANVYKEQRPDLIPLLLTTANRFFGGEGAAFGIAPLTAEEVSAYYRQDAMIWRVYLAFRKIDRFLHRHVLGKPYVYILPEAIRR